MAKNKRRGRNKKRREKRKAKRIADDKANRGLEKTLTRLGLDTNFGRFQRELHEMLDSIITAV